MAPPNRNIIQCKIYKFPMAVNVNIDVFRFPTMSTNHNNQVAQNLTHIDTTDTVMLHSYC